MNNVLADVAPQPSVVAGAGIVLILACLAIVAGLVVLIVWLVRRNRGR
ncbi:hypothetical protein [Dactylosporangium sp. CA-092794]